MADTDSETSTPTTDDPYLDEQARKYIDYRRGEQARHRWRIMTGQPRPEERTDPIRRALWDQIIDLEAIDQKAAAEAAKSGRVSTSTWGNFFLGWVKLQAAGIQGKSGITAAKVAEQGEQIKIAFDQIAEHGPVAPADLPPDIRARIQGYRNAIEDRTTGKVRPGSWAGLSQSVQEDLNALARDPRMAGAYLADLQATTGIDLADLAENPSNYVAANFQQFDPVTLGHISAAEQAQADAEAVLMDQMQSIKESSELIRGAGVSVPGGDMFNAFANVVMDEFPGLRDQFVAAGILTAEDAADGKAPKDPRDILAPAKEKLYAELEALGASTDPLSVETFRQLVSSPQFQSWVAERKYDNLPPREQFQAFLTEWRASNSSERKDSRAQQDETILLGKVPFSRLQVGMAKIRQWFRDQKARRNGGQGRDGQVGGEKASGPDVTAEGKPPSEAADVQAGGAGGKGSSPTDDVVEQAAGTGSGKDASSESEAARKSRSVGDADTISSPGPDGQRVAWKRTGPIQTSPDGKYIFNSTTGILWKKGSDGKPVPTARRDGTKFVPLTAAEVNAAQAKTPPEERSADPAAASPKGASETPPPEIEIQPSASAEGGSPDDVLPPGAEDMSLNRPPPMPEGWSFDEATGETVTETGYRLTPDGGMKDPSGRTMTPEEVNSFLSEDEAAQTAAPKPQAPAQTKPPEDSEVQSSVAQEVFQAQQEKKGEDAGGGSVDQVDPEVDDSEAGSGGTGMTPTAPSDIKSARERAAELAVGGRRVAADAERAARSPFPDEGAWQQRPVVPPGGAGAPQDRRSNRKRGKWEAPPNPSEEKLYEAGESEGSQGKALMQQQMLAAKSAEEQARLKRKYQTLYGLTGVG